MSRPSSHSKHSKARSDAENLVSIAEPEDTLPPVELGDLPSNLQQACARASWPGLMPVQSRSLPYLLAGRDLMVQSRTGSGKTGAYLLPMIERLRPSVKAVQALVLVPTRELALQVEREAQTLFGQEGLKAVSVYGGVGYGKQIEALRQGVSLVVGTPGRVLDHLLRRTLVLDDLECLVFDEADRMLSIGFYPDMKEVQRYLPQRDIPVALFSATYPPHVLKLAKEFMKSPAMLSLSHKQVHTTDVQHLYHECKKLDKDRVLLRTLEVENPTSAIIFCNTKANVRYVTAVLQGFGLNADELSADLSQAKREEVLGRLREGRVRFLVATDVAARGIDIPELSHVILYEPPEDRESYIHRAGRTGRAGAQGIVISLVDIMQKMELERIARFYKIPLTALPAPTEEEVARVVSTRLLAMLEARYRAMTNAQQERVRRFNGLAAELGSDSEQSHLIAMLFDEIYQKALHAVPEPPKRTSSGESRGRQRPGTFDKRPNQRRDKVRDKRYGETAEQDSEAAPRRTRPIREHHHQDAPSREGREDKNSDRSGYTKKGGKKPFKAQSEDTFKRFEDTKKKQPKDGGKRYPEVSSSVADGGAGPLRKRSRKQPQE